MVEAASISLFPFTADILPFSSPVSILLFQFFCFWHQNFGLIV